MVRKKPPLTDGEPPGAAAPSSPEANRTALSAEERLRLLEDGFLQGRMSEDVYRELRSSLEAQRNAPRDPVRPEREPRSPGPPDFLPVDASEPPVAASVLHPEASSIEVGGTERDATADERMRVRWMGWPLLSAGLVLGLVGLVLAPVQEGWEQPAAGIALFTIGWLGLGSASRGFRSWRAARRAVRHGRVHEIRGALTVGRPGLRGRSVAFGTSDLRFLGRIGRKLRHLPEASLVFVVSRRLGRRWRHAMVIAVNGRPLRFPVSCSVKSVGAAPPRAGGPP